MWINTMMWIDTIYGSTWCLLQWYNYIDMGNTIELLCALIIVLILGAKPYMDYYILSAHYFRLGYSHANPHFTLGQCPMSSLKELSHIMCSHQSYCPLHNMDCIKSYYYLHSSLLGPLLFSLCVIWANLQVFSTYISWGGYVAILSRRGYLDNLLRKWRVFWIFENYCTHKFLPEIWTWDPWQWKSVLFHWGKLGSVCQRWGQY